MVVKVRQSACGLGIGEVSRVVFGCLVCVCVCVFVLHTI